jgi:hypothetical protein
MSDRMLVATRKGLFVFSRGSGLWRITKTGFLGDNVSMVLADVRSGTWYAALDHGHFGCKMHRSRDEGDSWEECATPAYPKKPEDLEEASSSMGGKPVPWSLKLIWSLATAGDDQAGRLWCGTLPGGLFRSEDGGSSWEFVRSLWDRPERLEWFGGGYDYPGIHSICVDPRDANRVTVGVSCGGVWVTENGGETWACRAKGMRAEYMPPERQFDQAIQDPHLVVTCRDKPDCLWTQHHNGVFRTTDACASWQEIADVEPSAFGFAVAVHPRDSETAWFVPAVKDECRIPAGGKLVVTRTRDGGKSFEQLTEGLPQEHAYDIVFRHALDIDAAGERLAFGSTTGSLWVSENQGDAWAGLSTHLPPVHCVRFLE